MRWSLSTLLLATAAVAAGFGVWKAFWEDGSTNHWLLATAFVAATSVAAVAAWKGPPATRTAFLASALFGVLHLAVGLKGGFALSNIYDAQRMAKNAAVGLAIMGVVFLTTLALGASSPSSNDDPPRTPLN